MNARWGVTKFIDLKTFKNPSKGYLVNDNCIFGAEVFVVENLWRGECLTMIRDPELNCKYTWKLDDFSKRISDSRCYQSETFIGGDYKWYVYIY